MKTITVCQRKGGNHKTTISYNLAYFLGIQHKRILLIDLDSQCNLTALFPGISPLPYEQWKAGEPVPVNKQIDILPGMKNFERLKGEIQDRFERRTYLKEEILAKSTGYDYCIIDTAPALDILIVNALMACDMALIPVNPGKFSLNGLSEVMETIEKVKTLNSGIETKILLSGYHKGRNVSESVKTALESHFQGNYTGIVIPHREYVEQCMLENKPSIDLDEIYSEYEKLGGLVNHG